MTAAQLEGHVALVTGGSRGIGRAACLRLAEAGATVAVNYHRRRTNVKGVLYCAAAVAPGMIDLGWGRVINVSSNAAIGTALPGTTFYAATRAAVVTLTRRMAFELGPHGIAVNALLPGYTRTDKATSFLSEMCAPRFRVSPEGIRGTDRVRGAVPWPGSSAKGLSIPLLSTRGNPLAPSIRVSRVNNLTVGLLCVTLLRFRTF